MAPWFRRAAQSFLQQRASSVYAVAAATGSAGLLLLSTPGAAGGQPQRAGVFAETHAAASAAAAAAAAAGTGSNSSTSAATNRGPRRILIDTDPGVDDIWALLLAFGSPDLLQVEGMSIVFGNGKDITTLGANAKFVARLMGYPSIPVSLGETPPPDVTGAVFEDLKQRAPVSVHGEKDNMGNVADKYGQNASDFEGFHELDAADFIYERCAAHPGEVTLVCLGPLKNIQTALLRHPDLPKLVKEVVVMGGAFGERRGNRMPCAEANFYDAPEAAQAVLYAGFPKVVFAGLDVTHQTDMIKLRAACASIGSLASSFLYDVSQHYIDVYTTFFGDTIAPAHDAVPVMYLLRPDIFTARSVRVEVETLGEYTRGMSVADWKGRFGRPENAVVLTTITSPQQFEDTFVNAIRNLRAGSQRAPP